MARLLLLLLSPAAMSLAFVSKAPLTALSISRVSTDGESKNGHGCYGRRNNRREKRFLHVTTTFSNRRHDADADGGDMSSFFSSNREWHALFRNLAVHDSVPALAFLTPSTADTAENYQTTTPLETLPAIPTDPDNLAILASFLDSVQEALIAIPVNEKVQEDENDVHFIEEGRRLLVVNRFHVHHNRHNSTTDSLSYRKGLFTILWSEIHALRKANQIDTGSLILVPDYYDIEEDLSQFLETNVKRPLEWLGMMKDGGLWEVASMEERHSPAIRLIYRLSDIPTQNEKDDGIVVPEDRGTKSFE